MSTTSESFRPASEALPLSIQPDRPYFRMIVEGGSNVMVSRETLAAMPRTVVRVADELGRELEYEGVPLSALLAAQGVPLARALKGHLDMIVVATAADGLRVAFAMGEVDPFRGATEVLVADLADGRPLPYETGPVRLIVPHEKRRSRWVRALRSLEVLTP